MQSGSSSSSSVFTHTSKSNSYLVFLGHKVPEITAKDLRVTASIQYASGEENGPGCGWELKDENHALCGFFCTAHGPYCYFPPSA